MTVAGDEKVTVTVAVTHHGMAEVEVEEMVIYHQHISVAAAAKDE